MQCRQSTERATPAYNGSHLSGATAILAPRTETVRNATGPRSCLIWALIAASIGLAWQTATVYRNYGGNWTALFCIGGSDRIP